ncbi:GDP-mannose 4,6-dehydratase [Lysobacter soyae]|uniref:GDP-mannose 4,6-dehydratase n=1 Tax=Lysobacter soyae TaxID=2764185 RepID=A0ABX8WPE4_9GAMM|nr:GDP-mannose 4,6-dehydratase [Lysobacter sp. CJ11]QYR52736.1 GDP-mannose 4,6-dehydratase [Lysobacter sp. CJ11]
MNSVRTLLVTGASGFVGKHVSNAALEERLDWRVLPLKKGLDLRDMRSLSTWIKANHFDGVLHLGAQSFVPRAFENPEETLEINLLGTLHLLQSLSQVGFSGPFVYVSSGDVYGAVPEGTLPISEELRPAPRNPYAVSKVAAEHLCLQWQRTEGIKAIIARPFNHIGPMQGSSFVVPSVASQIIEAKRKKCSRAEISVGNIDVTRDFTDVRDVVAAYARLLEDGRAGEIYNVASGKERTIRELIESLSVLAELPVTLRSDPAKMRSGEQRRVVADTSKIQRDIGWRAAIPMEQTLKDILSQLECK